MKTNTTPKALPIKKTLFGLSANQLKLVVGGGGIIVGADSIRSDR